MSDKKVYLDHSATTPVDPEVKKAMDKYQIEVFGNASSMHSFGQKAAKGVEWSRDVIAKFLNCQPKEVYFTSGATEANNIVIFGIAKPGDHIITSTIEHPAILETCQEAEKRGVEVTYVNTDSRGIVLFDEIKKTIKENTVLISIMYVNNEIGTIQPIKDIGGQIKNINSKRDKKIYFHTDAVQAANYCDLDINNLGVDALSLSGHKIYGPKGIGILFVRQGVNIKPIQFGGHHEAGLRPGTLNTSGIVGVGKAVELLLDKSRQAKINSRTKKLRDKLIKEIPKKIPETYISGDLDRRIQANAHFCFAKVEGESILLSLDFEGIAVSTGSACSSGSLKPSHVLLAIGIPVELSHGSLRITLGKDNTEADINKLIKVLPPIITKLRKMSPLK